MPNVNELEARFLSVQARYLQGEPVSLTEYEESLATLVATRQPKFFQPNGTDHGPCHLV
jgi:antitoxin (DNA-binding transcriptional repressor) of toxin-antitoxin stability system